MKTIDFLAIGDIVTDAFIRLNDESKATVITDTNGPRLTLPFADKIPYEFVEVIPAVGNSANAAVAAARLGLQTALIAHIGDDIQGKECLDRLNQEKVSTDYIATHTGSKTNYHYVLWFNQDRTILVKHESYPYSLPSSLKNAPLDAGPQWLYLSSLGEHTEEYHREIAEWLMQHEQTKLVFQPGTFQIKCGIKTLAALYARSELFFCNVEEAQRILSEKNSSYAHESDIKKLLSGLHELGPRRVVITNGPEGSYAFDSTIESSNSMWFLPAFPDQKPAYERTGAGDSFASTTTSALIKGHSLAEAMKWGSVNSMSVVQYVGAQKGLLTEKAIQDYLNQQPKDWNIKFL